MMNSKIHITKSLYYKIYRIKNRVIFAPCEELKYAQKYLLTAIKWTYPLTTSTLDCAKIHIGKKWVLKMDIKDFYNSVPTKDITKVLTKVGEKIKDFNLFYNFNLATVNGKLPTGAVTSAHIANACFKPVETDIQRFCEILYVDFSRYMDDLTFSSDEKQVLKMVEKRVTEILDCYGYRVNKSKTKYISANKQQNVLGLVVNDNRVRLSKSYKKQIRAAIHNYIISLTQNTKYPKWTEKEYNSLCGSVAYIRHVEPKYYENLKTYYRKLLDKMYIKAERFENFMV